MLRGEHSVLTSGHRHARGDALIRPQIADDVLIAWLVARPGEYPYEAYSEFHSGPTFDRDNTEEEGVAADVWDSAFAAL